ncbi:MAG: hypothetical protein JSW61_06465 [Candidatus Thorarchaeota archaeon]|nr:MAG: hypothetical protein JSW61_06465 [Candidatus Thorarchaeota archaeon]
MSQESGNSDEENPLEDVREQARQLLELTSLVEKYPIVVARRVTGLVYILVAGAISFASLVFVTLFNIIEDIYQSLIPVLLVVGTSLFLAWLIAFRLIAPLSRSYVVPSAESEMSTGWKLIWGILAVLIVIAAAYTFGTGQDLLFAPILQFLMTIGIFVNYWGATKVPETAPFARELLVYAVLIGLSMIPILLFPSFSYVFIMIVDMGGIYFLGVYMLISAEKALLVGSGRE